MSFITHMNDNQPDHQEDIASRVEFLKKRIEDQGRVVNFLATRLRNTAILGMYEQQPELLSLHEAAVKKIEDSQTELKKFFEEYPELQ